MATRCHICAIRPADSREHLPGVAAANDGPVVVNYIELGLSPDNELNYRTVVEQDGLVVRTLCRKCNSRAGGNYGTAYKNFVLEFSKEPLGSDEKGGALIPLDQIQPLRILKQMTAMFLAAQPKLDHERWGPLQLFVRRRDMLLPEGLLRFYLYRNTSSLGRIVPLAALGALRAGPAWVRESGVLHAAPRMGPAGFSELSWPPMGIVYAVEEHPLFEDMAEITHWGSYKFKDKVDLAVCVPRLRVETHWPLGFGSPADVDEWSSREGIMHFIGEGSDDPSLPTNVGLTFHRADEDR
jgi:hypothetical protein